MRRSDFGKFWAVTLLLLQATASLWAQKPPAAHNISKYLGPGSCAAAACHGNIAPQKTSTVNQNEYSIWVVQDRHSAAYRVLQNPVSQRMGRLLGIGKPEESPKCLICHALYVPESEKGRKFDLSDGVSCESCHGPSSNWLGDHTTKGWTRQRSVAKGMINNWDVVKRSEQCLSCHLGDEKRTVDHEMIAAGHPDLVFDLESYMAAMPPHWKIDFAAEPTMRTWTVGQAVQLREALQRLARRSEKGVWPEYAEFECYSCHHNLLPAERSWRQKAGYPDRKPGNAPWNAAHFAVLRVIAREMDPEASDQLEKTLTDVFRTTTDLRSDRKTIAAKAKGASEAVDKMVRVLTSRELQREDAQKILTALSTESERLATMGPKTAEQATLAVQSLAAAKGEKSKDFDSALKGLYREVENPSNYNAAQFADGLRRAIAIVR